MKLLDRIVKEFKIKSATKARKLIKSGFVSVKSGIIKRPNYDVELEDRVELLEHSKRRQKKTDFEILFEDEFMISTHKPAGVLIDDFFKKVKEYTPVFLTHRLDQKVSGVMIFAKSMKIERLLEADWSNFEKIYIALVEGVPKKSVGKIESFLAENKEFKVYSTKQSLETKHAVTYYSVLETNKNQSRLEIKLKTGRKNQIRVHMSDLGCPILGDIKYGAQTYMKGRIALHARSLSFKHPVTKQRVLFEKEAPF